MKQVTIIYHSQSGNTARMAEAVGDGVRAEPEVALKIKTASTSVLQDLLEADALIFGSPENFGYMSGALKDFFDRTFYPAEPYELNLPYGVFISAGNDGRNAAREIDRIATGYPLRKVSNTVIARGKLGEEELTACYDLGLAIAAGTAMGIF